jgi:thiamine-phosphate pyrophosphorylase
LSLHGIYPIVDLEALERRQLPAVEFAERVLAASPTILQLRAKAVGAGVALAILRELVPRCRAAGCRLFANDRPDLAVLSGTDGIHVGQDDVPLTEVRRLWPELQVGVSTHTLAELERALAERPDYVAFGPVFTTASKADHEPCVGLDGLRAAHELAMRAGVPLVAIGGIDLARARDIAPHADAAAVIGALIPGGGVDVVTERARALDEALRSPR